MKRRGGIQKPTHRRRTPSRKTRIGATARASAANLLEEVGALTLELQEVHKQQAATSDVLEVISRSSFNLQSVLDTLTRSATKLCVADKGVIFLRDGELYRLRANYGYSPKAVEYSVGRPMLANRDSATGRAALEGKTVHISDVLADPEYQATGYQQAFGYRTVVSVPLLRDGTTIGVFSLIRDEVEPFTDKQIKLVQNFAAQALIAIENTRLLSELRESLEQQTATSEILTVISRSPTDAKPVFDIIGERAEKLCDAEVSVVSMVEGDEIRLASIHGMNPEGVEAVRRAFPMTRLSETITGRTIRSGATVHVPDVLADSEYENKGVARVAEYRACLGVPMIRDGQVVGSIFVARANPGLFTDRQVQLLKTFADQAVIAIGNVHLFDEVRARTNDLQESLAQQTATADVLKVISRSTFDLKSVLGTLVDSAGKLCGAENVQIFLRDGEVFRLIAHNGFSPEYQEYARQHPISPGRGTLVARTALEAAPVHIPDVLDDREYKWHEGQKLAGFRTLLGVPLLREGNCIGVMAMTRQTPRAFTVNQIELVTTFADQAVIAIENVRLFNETKAALERQTATAEILKVISSSPTDTQPVFEAIVNSGLKLFSDAAISVALPKDGEVQIAAVADTDHERADRWRVRFPTKLTREYIHATAILDRRIVDIPDAANVPSTLSAGVQRFLDTGYRAVTIVPMMRGDEAIGALSVVRKAPGQLTEKQHEILKTFAAQAVIAVENTRLLNELRRRTDDLSESLQQQTATSDILEVISNSLTDTQPAFDAIVRSGLRLFPDAAVMIALPDGDVVRGAAIVDSDPAGAEALRARLPLRLSREFMTSAAIIDRCEIDVPDAQEVPEELATGAQNFLASGYRAITAMPMMHGDQAIGALCVMRRQAGRLSDKQKELLRTFAKQAVIAIENTRLFNELRQRTDDLSESLRQQTATADVLKVISRSAFDLHTVLDTLLRSAGSLCDADMGVIAQRKGSQFYRAVSFGLSDNFTALIKNQPVEMNRNSGTGRALLEGKIIHIPDVDTDQEYTHPGRSLHVFRTLLGVPMMRDGDPVGVLTLMRAGEVRPFTDKQIELVSTFADQAAIAIENVRLFNEVQARTEDLQESLAQQTATADVLKIISRSAFDLKTVLETLLRSAARLCEAEQGTITQRVGDKFYRSVAFGYPQEFTDLVKDMPVELNRDTGTGRALVEAKVIHIPDVSNDSEYKWTDAQRLGGYRAMLGVPMLREGEPIGVLTLTRMEPRPFTEKQIELVTTFADQAAIAIENARLFASVEARTRELAQSLEELQATQDRLVQTQKLASLGQLTAGIAHEIKNPLNFVNNFSGVSGELIDELHDALSKVAVDPQAREEIDELAGTLRANLDKIIQHGKRADSIVKNMLLHSRSGSGEHRAVDLNAIVEESLNLAYHGARAEKPGFNITLERSFDPAAGEVDLYPQEITRVLLNLISNGFYAATKRKRQAGDHHFEPTLAAATKNLGDSVEIRIRDNGTGIPLEVKEKMFNPFFTTKPAGEGTGLGLSISHDIVVKQHGGSIEVDTQPGKFTEFRIILPRVSTSLAKPGGFA